MKHSATFRLVGLLGAAALLASCSVFRTMDWQKTTRHDLLNANAGRPMSHIVYVDVRPGTGTAISADQLVTWTEATRAHAYLISVGKGCPDLYLNGAYVTSTGDEVWAHSDHVIAAGLFRCVIQTIRPVDWLKVERQLARMTAEGHRPLPGDSNIQGG